MESYFEIGCPKFGMKREVGTKVHLKAHMTGSLLTMLQTIVTFSLQKEDIGAFAHGALT